MKNLYGSIGEQLGHALRSAPAGTPKQNRNMMLAQSWNDPTVKLSRKDRIKGALLYGLEAGTVNQMGALGSMIQDKRAGHKNVVWNTVKGTLLGQMSHDFGAIGQLATNLTDAHAINNTLINNEFKRSSGSELTSDDVYEMVKKVNDGISKRVKRLEKAVDKNFNLIAQRIDAQQEQFKDVITKIDHNISNIENKFRTFQSNFESLEMRVKRIEMDGGDNDNPSGGAQMPTHPNQQKRRSIAGRIVQMAAFRKVAAASGAMKPAAAAAAAAESSMIGSAASAVGRGALAVAGKAVAGVAAAVGAVGAGIYGLNKMISPAEAKTKDLEEKQKFIEEHKKSKDSIKLSFESDYYIHVKEAMELCSDKVLTLKAAKIVLDTNNLILPKNFRQIESADQNKPDKQSQTQQADKPGQGLKKPEHSMSEESGGYSGKSPSYGGSEGPTHSPETGRIGRFANPNLLPPKTDYGQYSGMPKSGPGMIQIPKPDGAQKTYQEYSIPSLSQDKQLSPDGKESDAKLLPGQQQYPLRAPIAPEAEDGLDKIPKNALNFIRSIGARETGFQASKAQSEKYNQSGNNKNVARYGAAGADYGFYQTNARDVEHAIKLGVPPHIAKALNNGDGKGSYTVEQQTRAMHEYLSRYKPEAYKKVTEGDYNAGHAAFSGKWPSLPGGNSYRPANEAKGSAALAGQIAPGMVSADANKKASGKGYVSQDPYENWKDKEQKPSETPPQQTSGFKNTESRVTERRKGESGEFNYSTSPDGQREFGEGGLVSLKTQRNLNYTVHSAAADRISGFVNHLESSGYKIGSIGGYANRQKAGGGGLSTHATGTTIDINPSQNPFVRGAPITDMPENIEKLAWAHRLSWGARFGDAMHFETMSPGAWKNKMNTLIKQGVINETDMEYLLKHGKPNSEILNKIGGITPNKDAVKNTDNALIDEYKKEFDGRSPVLRSMVGDKETEHFKQWKQSKEGSPDRFFFDTTRNYSKSEIDGMVDKYGKNIVIGGNPEVKGHQETMDYAKSKGAKTHDYLIGKGAPMEGWGKHFPTDHQEIKRNAKEMGMTVKEWYDGGWVDWNRKKTAEANAKGRYSVEWDNVNEEKDIVKFYKDQQDWAKQNGINTKISLKNMNKEQWEQLDKAFKDKTLDPNMFSKFPISENFMDKKNKSEGSKIAEKYGMTQVDTADTYSYKSPSEGYAAKAVPAQMQQAQTQPKFTVEQITPQPKNFGYSDFGETRPNSPIKQFQESNAQSFGGHSEPTVRSSSGGATNPTSHHNDFDAVDESAANIRSPVHNPESRESDPSDDGAGGDSGSLDE